MAILITGIAAAIIMFGYRYLVFKAVERIQGRIK